VIPYFQKEITMTGKKFLGISSILILGLASTLLFGGMWVTAAAAQAALPGDALYSVKTGLEAARTSISRDAAADAGLHMGYAEERLDEMAALIEAGRYEGLKEAAANFDFHVSAAIRSLALVAKDDPVKASELALSISDALARDTALLTGLLTRVPPTSLSTLEQALKTSQQAQMASDFEFSGTVEAIQDGIWMISGQEVQVTTDSDLGAGIVVGDLVKVEGFISVEGVLIVREIKLSIEDLGNNNDDGNINDNDDDGDLNDNDDDLNDNDDGNLNDNDDDLNDNDDGNLNDNDDDINDNDDGNLNDNDDDINDNDDGDLNDNDDDINDNDNSGGGDEDNDNGDDND
jgi:hypothetical protein